MGEARRLLLPPASCRLVPWGLFCLVLYLCSGNRAQLINSYEFARTRGQTVARGLSVRDAGIRPPPREQRAAQMGAVRLAHCPGCGRLRRRVCVHRADLGPADPGGVVAPRGPRGPRDARGPGPVLHRLSQRAAAHRRAGARLGGCDTARSRPRALGAGHREAAGRLDATAAPAAARRRDLRCRRGPPGGGARPRLGGRPGPRSGKRGASPEPHRVPQRRPRPVRARHRRDLVAAGRRDRGRQLRQLRRRPHDLAGASRSLPVGGPAGHTAGGRVAAGQPGVRDVRDSAARGPGRPARARRCRSGHVVVSPFRITSRSTASI